MILMILKMILKMILMYKIKSKKQDDNNKDLDNTIDLLMNCNGDTKVFFKFISLNRIYFQK